MLLARGSALLAPGLKALHDLLGELRPPRGVGLDIGAELLHAFLEGIELAPARLDGGIDLPRRSALERRLRGSDVLGLRLGGALRLTKLPEQAIDVRSASFTCAESCLMRASIASPHSGEISRATATARARSSSFSSRRPKVPGMSPSITSPSIIGRSPPCAFGPNPPARGQSGGSGIEPRPPRPPRSRSRGAPPS